MFGLFALDHIREGAGLDRWRETQRDRGVRDLSALLHTAKVRVECLHPRFCQKVVPTYSIGQSSPTGRARKDPDEAPEYIFLEKVRRIHQDCERFR